MSIPDEVKALISPPQDGEDPIELANMIAGRRYQDHDKYIVRVRNLAAIRLDEITKEADAAKRMAMWKTFANIGKSDVFITQRFFCEYGFNLHFAGTNFVGANCTFGDVCPIYIGERTMIGPDVKIYTPEHYVAPERRALALATGEEWGKSVTIEEDCWICGGAIILPGVTIGKGSTIAAGSVVTRDVPPRSVVMGNPGRVVKKILEDGTIVKV